MMGEQPKHQLSKSKYTPTGSENMENGAMAHVTLDNNNDNVFLQVFKTNVSGGAILNI